MKLYKELADWWQLFSPVEEYADEARSFIEILRENCAPECRTILELGAGAGSNAFYLKKHFALTLVDLSPEMLRESRKISLESEHLVGDMRDVRLSREFDAVFIHDAIMYLTNDTDLRLALETAFVHCKAGGTIVVAPDFVKETFQSETQHGGRDSDTSENRGLRWLEWSFDPNSDDTVFETHYVFLLKENGVVRTQHDCHIEGLFARQTWLRLFEQVGFHQPKILIDLYDREVFVAQKPQNQLL